MLYWLYTVYPLRDGIHTPRQTIRCYFDQHLSVNIKFHDPELQTALTQIVLKKHNFILPKKIADIWLVSNDSSRHNKWLTFLIKCRSCGYPDWTTIFLWEMTLRNCYNSRYSSKLQPLSGPASKGNLHCSAQALICHIIKIVCW